MPVNHRFLEHDFGNGFATHNAILDVMPYEPEVLFVGTYNPLTDAVNMADFFYGRRSSWFWPTMKNIFTYGHVVQFDRRQPVALGPQPTLINPPLSEIFSLYTKTKMTFADLIKSVFDGPVQLSQFEENTVTYEGVQYNLLDDIDLAKLNKLGHVNWTTNEIIRYIQRTPSIGCVRLTRQPSNVWKQQWNQIATVDYKRKINFGTIHTPAGRGLYEQGIPIATALARRWLHHPVTHKRLCDDWLQTHHVPVQKFLYPVPLLPLF